jgi:uncharacterized protein YfaA (DUF2138 family)
MLGTVRRLAFERELSVGEEVLRSALDEPAEVALWRDGLGHTRYWMLKLHRNAVAKSLEVLADIATSDTQLHKVAELPLPDGKAAVYALNYGNDRTLAFVARGANLVAVSDPGMLLQGQASEGKFDDKAAKLLGDLISDKADASDPLTRRFAFDTPGRGHHVALSADMLSFGYQTFFPSVDALRFDFDGKGWNSGVRFNAAQPGGKWQAGVLWADMPATAAACASVPLEPKAIEPMVKALDLKGVDAAGLANALAGPAALCWYGDSRLSSPLIEARFKSEADAKAQSGTLARLFSAVIGAKEKQAKGRFDVNVAEADGAKSWTRIVSARYGSKPASKAPKPKELSAYRFFDVTLAVAGNDVYFSPDGELVKRALAVRGKRYPAMADQMAVADATVMSFTPASLSTLLDVETFKFLPADSEALLREAASQNLSPKLKALAKFPRLDVRMAAEPAAAANGWVSLAWDNAKR